MKRSSGRSSSLESPRRSRRPNSQRLMNPAYQREKGSFMRAIAVERPGGDFVAVERDVPCPEENDVLIHVEACGVCHGEAIVKEGQFPYLRYPRVPGHEVVGTIVPLGARVRWRRMG